MLRRVFLERYEPVRQIGEGGMGAVYLARDQRTGQPAVVKVMHQHLIADSKARARFEREATLMARLRHPNAVEFFGSGVDEEHGPFLVMELVRGVALDKVLGHDTRFTPMRLRRLLAQLCDVLEAARAERIVHGDLKPANLMVVDFDSPYEKLKLMDFGLARLSDAPSEPDGSYAVGTAGYMPPEQVHGERVDHRGDLYSVGVILYRLLTGRLPFAGASTMDILVAQAEGNSPTFTELGLDDLIPMGVEMVVRACLAADPAQRPGSARELVQAYEDALASCYAEPEETAPPPEAPSTEVDVALPAQTTAGDVVMDQLEAWMPEQIAYYKLQGFAEAIGGNVIESGPGLVRLQLRERRMAPRPSGLFSWLGLGRRPEPPPAPCAIDMELHLRQTDPGRRDMLQVTLLLRPSADGTPLPPDYHARCAGIQRTLRSFLMAKE